MSIKIATLTAIILAGATLQAAALEGYDGDNHPIPGLSTAQPLLLDAHAAIRRPAAPASRNGDVTIGETRPGTPNAVYWRGRYLGTDPDPQVRLRILREAMGG